MPKCMEDGLIFGRWDPDDIFHYAAPKKVVFRDRRLCFTKILIILSIFAYTIIYAVILEGGYLAKDSPLGSIQATLRDPDNRVVNTSSTAKEKYCNATPVSGKYFNEQLPCKNLDYIDSVYPQKMSNGISITTRISPRWVTFSDQSCLFNAKQCMQTLGVNETKGTPFYVPFIEDYTLMVTHSAYGRAVSVSLPFNKMTSAKLVRSDAEGKHTKTLMDFNSDDYEKYVDKYIPQWQDIDEFDSIHDRPGDTMRIDDWLEAAEMSMDSPAPSSVKVSTGDLPEKTRYSGCVVLLIVQYESARESVHSIGYKYYLKALPASEYKVEEPVWMINPNNTVTRHVLNRHGTLFLIVQQGYIGRFNLTELLKTLVSAFALFAVATFFVEQILMRLLPMRKLYGAYKKLTTVDFGDVTVDEKGNFVVHNRSGDTAFMITPLDIALGTLVRGHNQSYAGGNGVAELDKPLLEYHIEDERASLKMP